MGKDSEPSAIFANNMVAYAEDANVRRAWHRTAQKYPELMDVHAKIATHWRLSPHYDSRPELVRAKQAWADLGNLTASALPYAAPQPSSSFMDLLNVDLLSLATGYGR